MIMGTTNFAFSHRCVVVSGEDCEVGNVPAHSNCVDFDRNFPVYELDKYEDRLRFFRITLTPGYYEGACIDYTDKDVTVTQLMYGDYPCGWDDKRLIGDIVEEFGSVSASELRKIISETRAGFPEVTSEWAYWDLFDAIDNRVTELLKKWEEVTANQILDEIKENWGYSELESVGILSDGTQFFRRMSA